MLRSSMGNRLKLLRPLVVFDLETTSSDSEHARIVSIGLVKLGTDGQVAEAFEWLVNPGVPIPAEASAVHGITDAMVADKPMLAAIVDNINAFVRDCDLAGFNLLRYDIPVIRREYGRIGAGDFAPTAKIVDAMKIYHQNERRDLTAAVKLYLGRSHDGAHGALADAQATADVLLAQVERYPDVPSDVAGLHAYCEARPADFVDAQGKLRWQGAEVVIAFGKHSGNSLKKMVAEAQGYLQWILNGDFDAEVKTIVRNALKGQFLEGR